MRGVFIRVLALALVLVLTFLAGALVMHFGMHGGQDQQILNLQARLETMQASAAETDTRLATLQGQLDVELATRRTLEETVTRQQDELGHTRDQLAFYEQLIPPGPAGALTIRAFELQRQGDFLRYRVLLTRNAPGREAFKGRLRFMASVQDGDNPAKIELAAATVQSVTPSAPGEGTASANGTDPLSLLFEQFQRSTGVLQLPTGVAIHSVTLEVLEDGVIRATRDAVIDGAATSSGSASGVTP